MAVSTLTTLAYLYARPILKYAPWLLLLWLLKYFSSGAKNTSERNMHSKVIMLTVRTSPSSFYTSSLVNPPPTLQ